MCGVFWEVKNMSWIFVSSYGGKLFLHICKQELFKSRQIWVDGNEFICSQEPYRTVNFDRDLATLFCVQEKFSLTAHCMASSGYITLYFGGGGDRGFWLCDIASLLMYCNDASLRTVTRDTSYSRYVIAFFSRCPVGEGTTEYTKLRFPEQGWRVH
jgi:hypothetical protein